MKKIGIFGSYNYKSIGDTAILESMISSFIEKDNGISILVFTSEPEKLEKYFSDYKYISKLNFINSLPINGDKSFSKGAERSSATNIKKRLKNKLKKNKVIYISFKKLKNLFEKACFDIFIIVRYIIFWKRIAEEIKSLDLLIIGGGNLLMDMFYRWPIYLFMYSFIARLCKTPMILYTVGVGPINTFRGKVFIKMCCRIAESITTRDYNSKLMLESMMIKKEVISAVDPAIFLDAELKKKERKVGISFVPYFDPRYWPNSDELVYKKYVEVMANIVNKFLSNYKHDIVFFGNNFPVDIKTSIDVYKKIFFKDRVSIIEKQLRVKEIISLISSFELLIGSRLHSIIFSAIAKTPFIAIAYQPKVNSFCKMLSMDDYVVNLDKSIDIDIDNFLSKIPNIFKDKKSIVLKLDQSIRELRKLNDLSCGVVFSILK